MLGDEIQRFRAALGYLLSRINSTGFPHFRSIPNLGAVHFPLLRRLHVRLSIKRTQFTLRHLQVAGIISSMITSKVQTVVSRIYISERALDTMLAVGLFLGALAIRLPNLMLIPQFTDETVEVLHSLKISQGILFPLTNADPYYGSIYNYLIAGVFYLFGPSAENARLTVTVLGALAVPLSYFFAKTMEDRLVGLVVALLMLTSGALILNGHVAWENNTTPFFAAATFLVFSLALKRSSGILLVASGLLYGLTLQTHPGIIILAAGLALYFIYSGAFTRASGAARSLRSWLKSPWPYLTLVAALVGYADVIAQSIIHPLIGWTVAQRHVYAYETSPTMETYLTNMQNFAAMVLRMAASNFDNRANLAEYLLQPLNALYVAFFVVGIGYAVKRGKAMPVIILVTTGLILPYFDKSYGYPGASRYVGYLFPLIYLLIATPLVQAARSTSRSQGLRFIYHWLLVVFLVVSPALGLMANYGNAERAGATNERVLSIHQSLRQQYLSGTISEIIIDNKLNQNSLGGGGNVQRALDYLFTLEGIPHRTMAVTVEAVKTELRKEHSQPLALVLAPETHGALSRKMPLSPIEIKISGSSGNAKYGAYVTE